MTPARTRSPMMHMGAGRATAVTREVPRLGSAWALFPPLEDAVLVRGERLTAEHLARLDARWAGLGLVGAAALQPVGRQHLDVDLGRDPDVVVCEDEDLTANVRLRVRGSLLVFAMPLSDRTVALVGDARGEEGVEERIAAAGLLCGDSRLHAAVVAGRHRRLGSPAQQLDLEGRLVAADELPTVGRDPGKPARSICGGLA